MKRNFSRGLTKTRLRGLLLALFAVLAGPALVLIAQTQRQMRWESYHQYSTLAGELALRIDAELQRIVAAEEARSYGDYGFLSVSGDTTTSPRLQRSELSQGTTAATLPGAIGWFQIDADGTFSTPLLPAQTDAADWGLNEAELVERRALSERVRATLAGETVATQSVKPTADAAAKVFDRLADAGKSSSKIANSLGRIDQLKLDNQYQAANVERQRLSEARLAEQQMSSNLGARIQRKEKAAEPSSVGEDGVQGSAAHVRLFESELDPFQFRQLDVRHAVLYRRVWRDGRRGIQGALLDMPQFLQHVVVDTFRNSALAPATTLVVALNDEVLRVVSAGPEQTRSRDAADIEGELLHQVRLSAPFDDVQLLWTAHRLPAGPGTRLVGWTILVLFGAMTLGLLAVYRLGLRQIELAAQQRDFVSAVSHELKTPLTSIRMYAEMLRAGWASDAKKLEYYDYIHDESERLTRLIGNVLQLARLERDDLALQPRPMAVDALVDMVRSRIQGQVERAGFAIEYDVETACAESVVQVDPDAFLQIVINLVDNALKFSLRGDLRRIELRARCEGSGRTSFTLRDHGPGVPPLQVHRIFEPFLRGGDELTREAPGTGIGLALARQLARAMDGDILYRSASPGAEFTLLLRQSGKTQQQ